MNNRYYRSNSSRPYPLHQSARITNEVNRIAYNNFNKWGGISYNDILSNYPVDIVNRCWENLGRFVVENYQSGKGTTIKGLGVFTFTNVELDMSGTTNQYQRDFKKRRPVFIVSNEFVEYLKPGIHAKNGNILYYTQKINNSVSIVRVNYAKIAYGVNISKEECFNILSHIFKQMGDTVRRGAFTNKRLNGVGTFLLRGNIFAMKFDDKLFEDTCMKTQSLIHTKKNFKLYMESKDSEGVRHKDIEDIDKAERFIRPNISVVTKISKSGDEWLRNNLDIDVKRDIIDEPRDDLFIREPINKREYHVDQRPYRKFPIQDLYGLRISQDILEGILNNKNLLLRHMKEIDRHGDGLIPKYDFINAFHDANVHHDLKTELIIKLTDLYINNDKNIIMIQYNNLINSLCNDIRTLINREYAFFPIEKYKHTIPKNNKRSNSSYAYSSNTGNLQDNAISSYSYYNKLPYTAENEIRGELISIQKVSHILSGFRFKTISYLELMNLLNGYGVYVNKLKMIKILRYLNIKNANAFNVGDFLMKLNQSNMNSNRMNFRPNNTFNNKMPDINTNTNYRRPVNITNDSILENLKKIKNKIYENSESIDKISKYFDKLLKYNICRRANIITCEEFERLLQLEKYNFTIPEISEIFAYIDRKKQGFIDRMDFITAIRNVPHPVETLQNFIRSRNLSVEELLYKVGFDLYNQSYNAVKSKNMDRLTFSAKLNTINPNFDKDFINCLFDTIGNKNIVGNYKEEKPIYVNTGKFIDMLNVNKIDLNFNSLQFQNDLNDAFTHTLTSAASSDELNKMFLEVDNKVLKKVSADDFLRLIKSVIKGKITDKNIMHFVRMNKFLKYDVNRNPYVNYHDLLMKVYKDVKSDVFSSCVRKVKEFLEKECNNDLYIFFVKMNNMGNSETTDKVIKPDRLYEFLRSRVNFLDIKTIMKFDFDKDGIISLEDVANTINSF